MSDMIPPDEAIPQAVQTVLDDIDSRMSGHLPTIAVAQAGYFAAHGCYAQGLLTHSTPPADGEVAPADRLTAHPTDQPESWLALAQTYGLTFPNQPLAAARVDTYVGRAGATEQHGYVIMVEVIIDGALYRRSINVGPQTYRTQPWQQVSE
jgi:hypothetical protein